MAEDTEEKKSEVEETVSTTDAAVIQVREVVKWLIGAFAAVGVLLAGGSQLSDIGHLDDHLRLAVACVGVLLVLGGVVWAIFSATRVLVPRVVSLKELVSGEDYKEVREAVDDDPSLLLGHGTSVSQFAAQRKDAVKKEDEAWDAFEAKEDDAALQSKAERATETRQRVDEAMRWLFSFARYSHTSSLFRKTLRTMTMAALLAAVGIIAFAWAAHPEEKPEEKSEPVVVKTPTAITVDLTDAGEEALADDLGAGCDVDHLPALALGGEADDLDVITMPVEGCSIHRFALTDELGTFENPEPAVEEEGGQGGGQEKAGNGGGGRPKRHNPPPPYG